MSGADIRRARWSQALATSQSWPWTRSNSSRSPSSTPAASMSEFIRSTQATNSPRSVGRVGSRMRWIADPAGAFLGRRLLAAPGQDVDLDPELDQRLGELAHVSRQATLDQRRVLPGEDQDAGHGRRARVMVGGLLKVPGVASGSGPGQANAYADRCHGRILWPRRAPASDRWPAAKRSPPPGRGGRGRPSRWPGRQAARARPARHGRRGARPGPTATSLSSSRRAAQARSATGGESQVEKSLSSPQLARRSGRRSGSWSSSAFGTVTSRTPAAAAPSSTAASQSGPSDHQWPSSSVSIAKTISPRLPRSAS